MGAAGNLIVLDTSEVLRAGPRNLHAAWMEVHNRKTVVTATVGEELAPTAIPPDAIDGKSAAEAMLQDKSNPPTGRRRRQLEAQSWWANVWRDPNSPYELRQLSDDETRLSRDLARAIPAKCFTGAKPAYIADHRDTKIVCEALVAGATLLLTSNMRTIKHERINAWCSENGDRFGFKPKPVVYHADATMTGWLKNDEELERGLKAAFLACWPDRNDASHSEVLRKTYNDLRRITGRPESPLHNFGKKLLTGLEARTVWGPLIEETRRQLPSPTVDTDRQHPGFPGQGSSVRRYRPVEPARNRSSATARSR